MERVGTVERTAQGLAIVRTEDRPDVGVEVVDERLDDVGRIVDVFGPVDAPYAAVSPSGDRPLAELLGETLYAR